MKSVNISLRRILVALFVAGVLLGFVPGLSDTLVLARPLFGPVTNGDFETGDFTGWTVNNSYVALPGDTGTGITTSATVQSSTRYEGTYAARLDINGHTTEG